MTDQPAHACRNCDGVDPDTCLANPHRSTAHAPADLHKQYAAAIRDQVRVRLGSNSLALAERGMPVMLNYSEAEDAADAALAVRDAELERLRAELGDLKYNLGARAFTAPDADTGTMLASLDARIRDALGRADRAESLLRRYVRLADVTHAYPIMGGHDSIGENFTCAGCALRDEIRAMLDEPKERRS
jgi:hypothetical protein